MVICALAVGATLLTHCLLGFALPVRETVVAGLSAPRGLTPLPNGDLLVAEVGEGRLLRLNPTTGKYSVIVQGLPTTLDAGPGGNTASGISAAVRVNGVYYFVVGEWIVQGYSELYRYVPGGSPQPMTGQKIVDRFPTNPLDNPYDLVPAPNGGFYVSDGGANAVWLVSRSGKITKFANFPDRKDPEYPQNPQPTMQVVPTGLAKGPDGALYVTSLPGYPNPPGQAFVYRMQDKNGDGNATDPGETTVFAKGFSAATDLAFEPDGSLLVTEYSLHFRRLNHDFGLDHAAKLPGALVRWHDGKIKTVAKGLISPTAVAVDQGRIFVSEEYAGRVSEIFPARAPWHGTRGWVVSVAVGILVGALSLFILHLASSLKASRV